MNRSSIHYKLSGTVEVSFIILKGYDMSERKRLFNGALGQFLRKYKIIRRTAAIGGIIVGLYFAGVGLEWWPNFLVTK